MEEVKKLPEAEKRLAIWVASNADPFPTDVFEMDPQKVQVVKTSKDRFDIHVEDSGVAKTAIYETPPPVSVEDQGQTHHVTVAKLLVPKGTRKTRRSQVSIIHGPMGWGREPSRIEWNWRPAGESGDDMAGYDARGPRIGWATAEQLKVSPDGSSSSNPAVLIRGSAEFNRISSANPGL